MIANIRVPLVRSLVHTHTRTIASSPAIKFEERVAVVTGAGGGLSLSPTFSTSLSSPRSGPSVRPAAGQQRLQGRRQ